MQYFILYYRNALEAYSNKNVRKVLKIKKGFFANMILEYLKSIKRNVSSLVKIFIKMIAKSYDVDAFDFKASMKATRDRD